MIVTIVHNGEKREIECKKPVASAGRFRGLGDIIASVATPIARALKLPCIDPKTKQLRPESRCNKVRKTLNKL